MEQLEQLRQWVKESNNIVFFWRRRCIYRERYTGFQECGRIVSSAV